MKNFLRILVFSIIPFLSSAQITTPVIRAGFGVEADLRANYFNNFVQSGNDDWFNNGTPGTGNFIIDTTGAAAILANYILFPASRMQPFFRTMRFPQYSVLNNRLLIDAVFIRDHHGDDSTVFAAGSNKNGMSPAQWSCPVSQGIPDKNDILDMFVHVRRAGPTDVDSLWMFGGISIANTTGNRYFDFEMYQTDIYYDRSVRQFFGYGPDDGHTSWTFDAAGNVLTAGDIIFTAQYGSSSLDSLEARIWVHQSALSLTPATFQWGGLFDGATSGAQYGYANITPITLGTFYTGLQSGNGVWPGPFNVVLQNNTVATSYTARQFMEFSVNLTKLGLDPVKLLGGSTCDMPFKRILVKTRASTSFTAELKDFVGPFDMFMAPEVQAEPDVPILCPETEISTITITNPHPTSIYTWSTTDGNIVGPTTGTSIVVDTPGTYIVMQQLMTGCPAYALDTIVITSVENCFLLSGSFKSFNASYNSDKQDVNLSWTAVNNQNILSFYVERSTDRSRWTRLGEIPANGIDGEQSYNYLDQLEPVDEKPVYYRIRLNNTDGSYRYSQTAQITPKVPYANSIVITPNPVREYLQLKITSTAEGSADISFFNQQGRLMKQLKEQVLRGMNVISLPDPAAWQKGVYFVMVRMHDNTYTQKMVIVD